MIQLRTVAVWWTGWPRSTAGPGETFSWAYDKH